MNMGMKRPESPPTRCSKALQRGFLKLNKHRLAETNSPNDNDYDYDYYYYYYYYYYYFYYYYKKRWTNYSVIMDTAAAANCR
jgi:hypothetical protein